MIHFLSQAAGFDAVANRHVQLFEVDGLADEIVRATAQGSDCFIDQNVRRDHDDHGIGLALPHLAQHVQTRTVRQVDVQQHRGRRLSFK